jgi:hypothetical protein
MTWLCDRCETGIDENDALARQYFHMPLLCPQCHSMADENGILDNLKETLDELVNFVDSDEDWFAYVKAVEMYEYLRLELDKRQRERLEEGRRIMETEL